MTGQRAMPNPVRVIRRSAGIVARVTGCDKQMAALTVYGIAVETMQQIAEETGDVSVWMNELVNAANMEFFTVRQLDRP